MKKLIAAASALALTAGLAFGETHETLKAHTLSTSVGDISFGAWGRSTFNVGRQMSKNKITADMTSLGNTAVAGNATIVENYKKFGGTKELAADASNLNDYIDDVTKILQAGARSVATPLVTAAVRQVSIAKLQAAADAGQLASSGIPAGTTITEAILDGVLATDATKKAEYEAAIETNVVEQVNKNANATDIKNAISATTLINTLKKLEKDDSSSRNYAALAPDWAAGCRVGFWIIGRTPDEHFGFDLNLDSDARGFFVHKLWDANEAEEKVNYNEDGKYAVTIGDQAKIWGLFDNPFFQTKLAFGRMQEDVLRGSIGDFGQRESSGVKSEDDIFSRIWTATGLFASITGNEDSPLAGFYMNGAVDIAGTLGGESASDPDSEKSIALYKACRDAQIGVGYTVPGFVQVKAQYWGDSIDESNFRYAKNKFAAARKIGTKSDTEGFGMNDYYGRMEFGIDFLGNMGGATSFTDPNLNLAETPNANLIELGFKVPIVTDNDLRDYDPETFYNWYSCLGTMGVIKQGFILYKGHVWGGQGTSNLNQYTDITGSGDGLLCMNKGDGANIIMAGFDMLAEVCINPFGKQDVFVGLSGNYNITSAKADGKAKALGNELTLSGLKLQQHNIGAEIYVKKTFAANNFMFAGIADSFSLQSMEGTVNGLVDLSYKSQNHRFYMPIGIEMFF